MRDSDIDDETAYAAFLKRDSRFEGQFFAAIKTTGIFCRPTCKARKPRRENVEFFATAKDALEDGYRPCKLCAPLVPAGETPPEVLSLLREIEEKPDERITDEGLSLRGMSPSRVRRWFLKNHGISFQAYQRILRINRAFQHIKEGGRVIDAAFDAGYESVSGFGYSFRKATAMSPKESRSSDSLISARITTPLGPMITVASAEGICLLEFADRLKLPSELDYLRMSFGSEILPGNNGYIARLRTELGEYFAGARKAFALPLVTPGTDFQKRVWGLLLDIPYGTTATYHELAARTGNPQAVRAAARANGSNRLALLIPCHRVIGSDGGLRGYSGGLARKRWLIEHEKKNADEELST